MKVSGLWVSSPFPHLRPAQCDRWAGFLTKLHGTDMVRETMRFASMFLILTMAGSGEG
jgi:hypothetical protein